MKPRSGALCFSLIPALLFGLSRTTGQTQHSGKSGGHTFQLTSSSFQPEGDIPQQFTCEGESISPELAWRNPPVQTKSFAIIVHDPDAPLSGGFTHWVLYNILPEVGRIHQHIAPGEYLAGSGIQGRNDEGRFGYMGPCPPSGTHRYYFYLYALDAMLDLKPGASKAQLENAMQGHILGKAQLMGRYKKN